MLTSISKCFYRPVSRIASSQNVTLSAILVDKNRQAIMIITKLMGLISANIRDHEDFYMINHINKTLPSCLNVMLANEWSVAPFTNMV